jgi:phage terminase large subunit-like protein
MEDQMCNMLPEGYADENVSPDRVDALVWAVTDLMLQKPWMTEPRMEVGLPVFGR